VSCGRVCFCHLLNRNHAQPMIYEQIREGRGFHGAKA
jgi:hypothetical protein